MTLWLLYIKVSNQIKTEKSDTYIIDISAIKEVKMTEFMELIRNTDTKVSRAKDLKIIKINLLKEFCRNRTKLYLYLFRLDIYIYLNLLKFYIMKKCILFVAFYIRKKIYKWFKFYLSNYINYAPDNRC